MWLNLLEYIIYIVISTNRFTSLNRNAQLVIDALSERVLMNLDHIKGAAIVAGDYRTLSDLVKLLLRIESISIPDNRLPSKYMP
jgi:hypothetical protein